MPKKQKKINTSTKNIDEQLGRIKDFIDSFTRHRARKLLWYCFTRIASSEEIEWTDKQGGAFVHFMGEIFLVFDALYELYPFLTPAAAGGERLKRLDAPKEAIADIENFLDGDNAIELSKKLDKYIEIYKRYEWGREDGYLDIGQYYFAAKQVKAIVLSLPNIRKTLF